MPKQWVTRVVVCLCWMGLPVWGAACAAPLIVPPTVAVAPSPVTVSTPGVNSVPLDAKRAAAQVLRVAYFEPAGMDPHTHNYDWVLNGVLFENLYSYDADGNLVPALAQDMPEVSEDGLTYTIRLREGLKFSDGSPLTAHDLEWSWKRALDPRSAYDYAFTTYPIAGAQAFNMADPTKLSDQEFSALRDSVRVNAIDDRTLQFTLTRPTPWFSRILGIWTVYPVKQSVVENFGDKWTEPGNHVGNGPFLLKEWEHDNKIVLEANPHYRLGPPTIQRIELPLVANTPLTLQGYQNDEFDITNYAPTDHALVRGDAALMEQAYVNLHPSTAYITFDSTRPPFDDVKVRQAFSMAVDRAALVASVYQGTRAPAEQLVPPGLPGHYEDLRVLSFDPARARALLAEAGYSDGESLPEIKFTFPALPAPQLIAEFYQQQFQENLGIHVQLDPVDPQVYGSLWGSPDTRPQMGPQGWAQDYPDPQNWYSTIFHSNATMAITNWSDAEFDRLTDEADVESDPVKRDALYKQAAQILMDAAPVMFGSHGTELWLVKPHVKNCPITPSNFRFPCRSSIMSTYIEEQ